MLHYTIYNVSYHCLEGFRLTLSKKIIKANNVIKIVISKS